MRGIGILGSSHAESCIAPPRLEVGGRGRTPAEYLPRVQKRVEGAAEGLERVAADADRRAHEPTPSGVVEYRVSGTVEYILGRVRSFLSSSA